MLKELESGVLCKSAAETRALAAKLAAWMGGKGTVALSGPLGAGKTVFAKGLAEGLGVREAVKSPSYNILFYYRGGAGYFAHIDAYRVNGPDDFESLLLDEVVPEPRLVCIEWPEKIGAALDPCAVRLEIIPCEDESRLVRLVRSS